MRWDVRESSLLLSGNADSARSDISPSGESSILLSGNADSARRRGMRK
jgi:hypothetical protein